MEDLMISPALLVAVFFLVALLYSSVGLGGGSSYTALLAAAGAGMHVIPMVSLTLNIIVSSIGSFTFFRHDHARLRLITPFMVTSIPMAYVGGALKLPKEYFYWLLLISLLLAAAKIYFPNPAKQLPLGDRGKILISLAAGAALGLVAGIVGIGGGIYLVPLVILLGLGTPKEAAACGSFFIWANSVSGMVARLQHNPVDLLPYMPLIFAVLGGGLLGSYMGAAKLSPMRMQKMLGSILLVAICFMLRKMKLLYI